MCPQIHYNYMTSNSAEPINNLSRHVRNAPITMLMEWYKALLQKWHCARREKYQDSSIHILSDCATHKVMDKMQNSANWKVYEIHQALLKMETFREPTQTIWKRTSTKVRPESNTHNNFGGRSQQYKAAYSSNHGRSQEFAQAYNNMIGRSHEYKPAYTNNHGRSQEYKPVYNNMIRRSQEYSPAYNNNNGRLQEYEAAYNNIKFSGMAQDPHPTMPFAFNQFNFG
ncbi:hypothetical protein Tco_1126063 [Tanacetum coccineum]